MLLSRKLNSMYFSFFYLFIFIIILFFPPQSTRMFLND